MALAATAATAASACGRLRRHRSRKGGAQGGLGRGRTLDDDILGRLGRAYAENSPSTTQKAAVAWLYVYGRDSLASDFFPVLARGVDFVEIRGWRRSSCPDWRPASARASCGRRSDRVMTMPASRFWLHQAEWPH